MEAKTSSKVSKMRQRSDARLASEVATNILTRYPIESILDVGCGDGIVSKHLAGRCSYKGIDISDACIYEKNQDSNCIVYASPADIPALIEDGSWDTILLLDVLEHTRDFTGLFELSLRKSKRVVVSLPNELFVYDRIRMLLGHELNAHSLDLLKMPEGFKHQFIINIDKARGILSSLAESSGFNLAEEVQRPLMAKGIIASLFLKCLEMLGSANAWSMGSVFIFERP